MIAGLITSHCYHALTGQQPPGPKPGPAVTAALGETPRLAGLLQGRQIFSSARTDHLAGPGARDTADETKPDGKLRQPVTPGLSPPEP